LEEAHPVKDKDSGEQEKKPSRSTACRAERLFSCQENDGQSEAGENDSAKDDQERRQSDPFAEQPGQAKESGRDMDFSQVSLGQFNELRREL